MMHPASTPLRRGYADGPSGQIHYYDSGGDGPALLLLHQSPASSSDYFPIIPYFTAAGLRVIAMDTPGMGLSDPPPQEPSLQDYAAAVPHVLNAAGVDSAYLLGHHTGVQIAIEAAIGSPDRVRGVALYGVPLLSAEERQSLWERFVPREKEGEIHKPAVGGANFTAYLTRVNGFFGAAGAQRMLLSGLMAGPLWWYGHNAALLHDMKPALIAAAQPLLLISHLGEMLLEHTREAARLRPDAELAILDVEGSQAMDCAPGALAAAVIAFIARNNRAR